MNTIEFMADPVLRAVFLPGVVAALAIAVLCGVLSVFVVTKRLAFVSQGVSHAAFGGVGVALVLGLGAPTWGGSMAVVFLFCAAAALAMGWLGRRSSTGPDTAIGIVLVASMALGFILHRHASLAIVQSGGVAPPGLDAVLFGSITNVTWAEAWLAWGVALAVLALVWWFRRQLVFFAFDEPAAEAFGVRVGLVRALLMVLLAGAVVVTMRLAGVVLATALLVIPGATALALSARLKAVFAASLIVSVVGVAAGLVMSFEWNLQIGPGVALALCGVWVVGRFVGGWS